MRTAPDRNRGVRSRQLNRVGLNKSWAKLRFSGKAIILFVMPQQTVEEFATQHGNNFHAQVVSFLRKAGWSVTVSPFYRDNATDKAREADVFADKVFDAPGEASSSSSPVRLLIECKYVTEPIVFWFDEKAADQAVNRIIRDIPILKKPEENGNIEGHHWYSVDKVAKLFATFNPNKSEERQPENEIIFSSIDKVLNCLIYHRNTLSSSLPKRSPGINYPLIVLDGFSKLSMTTMQRPASIEPLDEKVWFPVEVNYAYIGYGNGMRFQNLEYFLVDIVNFTRLSEYLRLLEEKDIGAAKLML